jgi:hypothetical protein
MRSGLVALSIAVLGATLFVSSADAQGHGGFAGGPGGHSGSGSFRGGGGRGGFSRGRHGHRFFGDEGYWPYFYSDDYDWEPETTDGPPPQYITPQPVQSTVASPAPVPAHSEVLELQGDQWVRLTNYGASQSQGFYSQPQPDGPSTPRSSATPASSHRTPPAEPARELPPAVLVFRDGHKEEIRKYVIMNGTVITNADYWTSGSWTRKVQLAELNIPATLEANRELGTKFSLPSGPSEVIMRP